MHAHESVFLTVQDRPVDAVQRLGKGVDRDPLGAGLLRGQTDLGHFRRRVRAPRNDEFARPPAPAEERVLDHDTRHEVGRMRELEPRADVAARIDLWVGRAQALVDPDALAVVGDAGRLEPESFHIGGSTHRDEQGIRDAFLLPSRRRQSPANAVVAARDAQVAAVTQDANSIAFQRRSQHGGGLAILARENAGGRLDQHDFGAETGEPLRELAADGARADHREPARQVGQGENGFVRQVRHGGEPGNIRRSGPRARRDRRSREVQRPATDLDRVGACEARVTQVNINPQFPEARRGVVRAQVGAQPAEPRHHGGKIDRHVTFDPNAERSRLAHGSGGPGRAEQRLRGHTADIEAVAAQQVTLHERNLCPKTRGAGGGHESGGATADHDEVVAAGRCRVYPVRRMNLRLQAAVMFVPGAEGRKIAHAGVDASVRRARARRAIRVTRIVTATVAAKPIPYRIHSPVVRVRSPPPAARIRVPTYTYITVPGIIPIQDAST